MSHVVYVDMSNSSSHANCVCVFVNFLPALTGILLLLLSSASVSLSLMVGSIKAKMFPGSFLSPSSGDISALSLPPLLLLLPEHTLSLFSDAELSLLRNLGDALALEDFGVVSLLCVFGEAVLLSGLARASLLTDRDSSCASTLASSSRLGELGTSSLLLGGLSLELSLSGLTARAFSTEGSLERDTFVDGNGSELGVSWSSLECRAASVLSMSASIELCMSFSVVTPLAGLAGLALSLLDFLASGSSLSASS